MKSCVTIALVPQIRTGPWIYWDDLAAGMAKAAALRFDAVELFTASAEAVDPDKLMALTDRYGLRIGAVGTGAGKVLHGLMLTDPDPDVRARAVAFIGDMIRFGARFGAPAIIGSMQGNVTPGAGPPGAEKERALDWLTEGLTTLGRRAADEGVFLIYEPLNRYETNLINTLDAGVKLLENLDTGNVKLLADLFHMNIEEADMAASIRSAGAHIGHVHFADSNRWPIGGGHTAMAEIVTALRSINYTGYVSAEAFPYPTPDEAARQTMASFTRYLTGNDA